MANKINKKTGPAGARTPLPSPKGHPLEKDEQKAFVHYCRLKRIPVIASLNGVYINSKEPWKYISSLKAQGMEEGYPDLFIPKARKGYHGLYIEMKRIGSGVVSEDQERWLNLLTEEGYRCDVCYGFDQAKLVVDGYLK